MGFKRPNTLQENGFNNEERNYATSTELEKFSAVFKNTIKCTGDSITALNQLGDASSDDTYARGYLDVANTLLGGAFEVVYNGGVGGERTDEILNRYDEFLLYSSYYDLILAGTNNVIQEASSADAIADLEEMYNRSLNNGSVVVACTIPPLQTYTGDQLVILKEINSWIRKYSLNTNNVLLVDFFAYCVESSTGQARTDFTIDDVHPSIQMAYNMARAIESTFSTLINRKDYWGGLTSDSGNLLDNPSFNGSDSLADDWTIYGTNAQALSSSDDFLDENYQELTITSGNYAELQQRFDLSGEFSDTDRVLGSVELDCSNMTDLVQYDLYLNFYDGSEFTDQYHCMLIESANKDPFDVGEFKLLLSTKPNTIPEGTQRIYFNIRIEGVGTAKVRKPSLINLDA